MNNFIGKQVNTKDLASIDPNAVGLVTKDVSVYCFVKRLMDIVISTTALVVLAPLMILISILIPLGSSGSPVFVQKRVGVKQKRQDSSTYWQKNTFQCYKFRTMVSDAESTIHQSYMEAFIQNDIKNMAKLQGKETSVRKLMSDIRVTKLGYFLRKFSLDELPQFWNVLKGDMSLVGPRPAIQYEVDMYEKWHHQRLMTKPGLTGLWQVTARSSVDFDEIVRLDVEYVQNQSLWLDIKILLKTPIAVFSTKGAK